MNSHLINGSWVKASGTDFFQAFAPAKNAPIANRFSEGGDAEAALAAQAAQAAFVKYAALSDTTRAAFLRAVADNIDKCGDEITATAAEETALPAARLEGERGRTVGQLRMFATLIENGAHLDMRHDTALPDRTPPRPELHLIHRPLGPVAVFGASNFPLAFSVAGGDTASALAAGCPVIVKGHPAHPATGELVARAVAAAMEACAIPPGTFGFIQGAMPDLSRSLVAHPAVSAVGFTGSARAGRALFDVACRRPAPIPFYAEMGSINPVFLLANAAKENIAAIAQGWAQSLTLGGGQFCTNPGVVFCPTAQAADFLQTATEALAAASAHTMLTPGIAAMYRDAIAAVSDRLHWQVQDAADCNVNTAVLHCTLSQWLETPALREEIFGPAGVVVAYQNTEELLSAATMLSGQLTATVWHTAEDYTAAQLLLPVLEQKAGRLLCNGFPTGVEVAGAMMHGGPYPAATYPSTSVGALAIRRFLRPVCYQNFPQELLPEICRPHAE